MKILIIGTGVIGTTYAWQLSQAGNDVTLYVKENRLEECRNNGLKINCTDLRHKIKRNIRHLYHPQFTSEISDSGDYELIIVPVNSNQISGILPELANYKGSADIMFFHNKWTDNSEIDKYLKPSRYFFGFPFKAGGGRNGNAINTVIFGESICATMLGEVDGRITPRIKKIAEEMKRANMNPKISRNIMGWLWTHYIWGAANLAAYVKAGTYRGFAESSRSLRECYMAMRDGFKLCRARGANAKRIYPVMLFYLPLFLLIPYTKHLYKKDGMQSMFEGHISHSPDEMKAMYYDILNTAQEYGIDMPYYGGYRKYMDEYFNTGKGRIIK